MKTSFILDLLVWYFSQRLRGYANVIARLVMPVWVPVPLTLSSLIVLPKPWTLMEEKTVQVPKLRMDLWTEVKPSLNTRGLSTPCVLEPNLLR